ncbi:MAG: hypothetical protein FWD36_01185 [Treponema sp.]|nr:hypothetical protein [Treponema sp.]
MKTKHFLFFVLCSLFCVLGCNNLFEPPNQRKAQTGAQETGMGTFTLYVADAEPQGRTIMPYIENEKFDWYKLEFSQSGVLKETEGRTFAELTSDPIELPAGRYDLTVYAYIDRNYDIEINEENDRPAAWGEVIGIPIEAGQNVIGSVALTAYRVGTDVGGNGSFSWDISFPAGGAMEIRITPFDTNLASFGPFSLADNTADPLPLPAGYYRVVITLTQPNKRAVVWRETLHVYQNMNSHYEQIFGEAYFAKASFDVTFNLNFPGAPAAIPVSYFSEHFKEPGNRPRPTHTNRFMAFGSWHTPENLTSGDAWDFETPLTGPLELYARWNPVFAGEGASNPNAVNSTYLIDLPGVPRGWWLQPPIQGRWQEGYMIETEEGVPIEVPVFSREYTYTQLSASFTNQHLPGGIGTWSATRTTGATNTPGSVEFIDVLATEDAGTTVYRSNFDIETYGGSQPSNISATANAFLFSVNMSIPIKTWRAYIQAALPVADAPSINTFTTAGQRANRHRDIGKVYMVDYPNPATLPTVILHEDFERSNGAISHFNNTSHNAHVGWFTHVNNTGMTASGVFDNTNNTNSAGTRSLRLTWSTNNTASRTVRIGQRANFQAKNLTNYTHIRFWARTNAAGAGDFSVIMRNDNTTDLPSNANIARTRFTANQTWQEFQIPIQDRGSTINYLAFQAVRTANITNAQLWIDDISFVNTGNPVAVAANMQNRVVMSVHDTVYPNRIFTIEFEADTTHYFATESEYVPYPYPVFESGVMNGGTWETGGVCYWRERGDSCTHDATCVLAGCMDDYWNLDSTTMVNFYNFTPLAHGATGTISVRAHDSTASGVTWLQDDNGPDQQIPTITSNDYDENGITQNLYVGSHRVGTINAKMSGHVQSGATLSSVNMLITYVLDEAFIPFIASMTCNGVAVTGTGGSRTVTLTGLSHGTTGLTTAFVFQAEN